MLDAEKAFREIAEGGYMIAGTADSCPVVVAKESQSDRLFDMLRNDTAAFGQFEMDAFGAVNLVLSHVDKRHSEGATLMCYNRDQNLHLMRAISYKWSGRVMMREGSNLKVIDGAHLETQCKDGNIMYVIR